MTNSLPAGYTLDQPETDQAELPPGYTVDASPQQTVKPDFWSSKPGRFLHGASEPAIGLGQLAAHATGYGKEYMDELAQQQAESYARSRAAAGIGPEDWDYAAGLGNLASPVTWVPGGIVGRVAGKATSIPGLVGRGAAIGTGLGAIQPVSGLMPDETYGQRKLEQTSTGAITGALAEPLMAGAEKLVTKVGQQFYPAGRRQAAADWLSKNMKNIEERPGDALAALQSPDAQGTAAERTGSSFIAGLRETLAGKDKGFAARMEAQDAATRQAIESGVESTVEGGQPLFLRDQALAKQLETTADIEGRELQTVMAHDEQVNRINEGLEKVRETMRDAATQAQESARSQFAARGQKLSEREATAHAASESVNTTVDDAVAAAEQRARDAASTFSGGSPEARRMANLAGRDVLEKSYDAAKQVERDLWSGEAIDKTAEVATDGFNRALAEAREYANRDPLPASVERIRKAWEAGDTQEASAELDKLSKTLGVKEWLDARAGAESEAKPITVGDALKDRSVLLSIARDARSGATPDSRTAAIANILADGILEDLSKVEGANAARNFSRAIHDRFSRTFAGDILQTRGTGASRVPHELTFETAMGAGGPKGALQMSQLEEATMPLAAKTTSPMSTPDLSPEMRAAQERFLRTHAEKLIDPATGQMSANATDRFLRDNADLLQRFPGLAEDLQAASSASREAKTVTQEARLTKAQQQAKLTQTLRDIRDERTALERASIDKLINPETGEVRLARVEPFLRENAEALKKFPGLAEQINELSKGSQAAAGIEEATKEKLKGLTAAHKEKLKAFQNERDIAEKSVFGRLAAVDDPATIVKQAFRGHNPASDLQELGRLAKGGDDHAQAGFRRLIFDHGSEQSTKNGTLDFQKLHDFYFKAIGNTGRSVNDILRQTGAASKIQMDGLREMIEKGIAHQNYRRGATVVPDIATPIGAFLEGILRSVGTHYGALLPGSSLHGAAVGSRLATRAAQIPAARMEDLFKQALEDPALMKALLEKATPKNEAHLHKVIRGSLLRAGIISGVDIDSYRPQPAY